MDLNSLGVIGAYITAIAGLILALAERRKKKVDIAEQLNQMAFDLTEKFKKENDLLQVQITKLRDEVTGHQVKIARQNETMARLNDTIARQNETIASQNHKITELEYEAGVQKKTIQMLEVMNLEKDQILKDRDEAIVHLQSQINELTTELHKLKKSTDKLNPPENGV